MATIKILNIDFYEIIDSTQTNANQGNYSLELIKGDKYRIEISAENYYSHLAEITIPKSLRNNRITRNFQLFEKKVSRGVEMNLNDSTFIDLRDNNMYRWTSIGDQIWMTENLNYFPEHIVGEQSWCYEDNELYCSMYGRLYQWVVANQVCPVGWHLPSDEEWLELESELSDETVNLLVKDDNYMTYGIRIRELNQSGFNPIAGGRRLNNGVFEKMGESGFFWSDTKKDRNSSWYRELTLNNQRVRDTQNMKRGCSVRCVKNKD